MMDDIDEALRELGMSRGDSELDALSQLEQSLADGTFTTDTFLSGQFQTLLEQGKILLLENPHGEDQRWHYIFLREGVEETSYSSPPLALMAAIAAHRENAARVRELREMIDRDQKETEKYFLEGVQPALSLSQPWSLTVQEELKELEEAVIHWGTDREFVKLHQEEQTSTYTRFAAQVPKDDHLLGTIHMRAISETVTEVIYIPGAYHIFSAITTASLYGLLQMISLPDSAFSDDNELQESNLDFVFDAWYAEKRKGKRISLKQWAAQSNISYYYLSRHHKAYKERQLYARVERNESQ